MEGLRPGEKAFKRPDLDLKVFNMKLIERTVKGY